MWNSAQKQRWARTRQFLLRARLDQDRLVRGGMKEFPATTTAPFRDLYMDVQ